MICGSEEIKETFATTWVSRTTRRQKMAFSRFEKLGLGAGNAPMVQLNDDFYENLTPETTIQLLDACAAGNPPKMTKWGSLPMNGQLSREDHKEKPLCSTRRTNQARV